MTDSPVKEEHGMLWLDISRVRNLESLGLQDFDLVEFNGIVYELQGRRPSDGWWWIRAMADERPTEEELAEYGRMMSHTP
jgi:hypothetical protein